MIEVGCRACIIALKSRGLDEALATVRSLLDKDRAHLCETCHAYFCDKHWQEHNGQ